MFFFSPAAEGQLLVATPGAGIDVPIWLLGLSPYSAKLAGELGLPYSFAIHFRPSHVLKSPYVMVGVQAVAAETNDEAEFLATSLYQSFLGVLRRTSFKLKPPVKSMAGLWTEAEEQYVTGRFKLGARGGPEKVKKILLELAKSTDADELIITSGLYDQQKRIRSYELIAQALSA